ncbi:MAG TPA: acyltransferase family protein [Vicinamibacterales bacterium]|nr:acyltransferase family protein [Vicinamibacterales bacterium]
MFEPASSFGYRPALDGVRAVAVLAVIGYHLGYTWLPGGFLGVDIFFVLSGYLITTLLLLEYEAACRINLKAFWFRRARRLLPGLFLVLLFVTLHVALTAPPFELGWRRHDILWTLFYGANWHFIASDQSYFSQFTSASPLRHTWSLAIEEQFYLLWPVILLVACPRGRRALAILCMAGIVGSVAVSMWLFNAGDPSRSYYGTDTRMHELLIGALLAAFAGSASPRPAESVLAARLAAAAGGLALLGGFFWLDGRSAAYYFGLSAAVAMSTAALIWSIESAPGGVVARSLSLPPMRWTGQISYGLYLWHWPVILAIGSVPAVLKWLPGSMGLNLIRVGATFALAAGSFYLLEEPVRRGRMPWVRSSVPRFATAAAVTAVLIAGAAVWATPMPPETGVFAIAGCPGDSDTPCLRHRAPTGAPVVALIGDSVARSLDPALSALAREHRWTYVLAAANGCRISTLLTSYEGHVRPMDARCQKATPGRLERLVVDWNPRTIIAIDRWEIMDAALPDGRVVPGGTPEHVALVENSLADAARRLTSQGAHLVFIELPPILSADCGAPGARSLPRCHALVRDNAVQDRYNEAFRRIARQVPRVATLSITDTLCPGGVCAWDIDGLVLRFDGLHFTPDASRWLAPLLLHELSAVGAVPD